MSRLTYKGRDFYLDGKKLVILSGTIHYFRNVPECWEDRLIKLKECGMNTVETYTAWNLHERREGEFDFSGMLDVAAFSRAAAKLGLYMILRPGPYICSEWEFGGFPSWLLACSGIKLRCDNEVYLSKVRAYFARLFRELRPCLAENGGNIIMVQAENEYGSFGDDHVYMRKILDIYRELGVNELIFTSDGPCASMLTGGSLPGTPAAVNFGSKPEAAFKTLAALRPDQPLFCAEYWNGWFDHWYEVHHKRGGGDTAEVYDEMLRAGASVNFYMFCGGTNFGFTNGANLDAVYAPTVTSYDYDAPLTESGDITEKYMRIRAVIEKNFGKLPPLSAQVVNSPKRAYGKVEMTRGARLFDNLDALSKPVRGAFPPTFEELGCDFGFVLYRSVLDGERNERHIHLPGVHDRAIVYLDGKKAGVYERGREQNAEVLFPCEDFPLKKGGTAIDILVENMGRVNYGPEMRDEKGLIGGVRHGAQYHFGWTCYPLTLDDISGVRYGVETAGKDGREDFYPAFLEGDFEAEVQADTFVRADGFTKGNIFINGFNLGRYYNPAGPQKTLYIPAPLIRKGKNTLTVFELEGAADKIPSLTLTDKPDLG